MEEKDIDNIVKFIPFKKLRASVLEYFKTVMRIDKNTSDINNFIYFLSNKVGIDSNRIMSFKNIYDNNYWGESETFSGEGSTIKATEILRQNLEKLFKEFDIKTLLDIPCGDFNWMKELKYEFDFYLGCDIVYDIITNNKKAYETMTRKFQVFDIVENIPTMKFDAIFCRDLMIHLPIKDISKIIDNIIKSDSRYLISNTYSDTDKNTDVAYGGYRPINLEIEPFYFPKPIKMFQENSDYIKDKYIAIWEINKLQSRAEQSRAEQSRAEQSRAEQTCYRKAA